jgi:hypothetical protein
MHPSVEGEDGGLDAGGVGGVQEVRLQLLELSLDNGTQSFDLEMTTSWVLKDCVENPSLGRGDCKYRGGGEGARGDNTCGAWRI